MASGCVGLTALELPHVRMFVRRMPQVRLKTLESRLQDSGAPVGAIARLVRPFPLQSLCTAHAASVRCALNRSGEPARAAQFLASVARGSCLHRVFISSDAHARRPQRRSFVMCCLELILQWPSCG